MSAVGLDLSDHRSRLVTPELLHGADLVIGMARQHVMDLALLSPDTWERCFTIADVLRRGQRQGRACRQRACGTGPGGWEASEPVPVWWPSPCQRTLRIRWAAGLGITSAPGTNWRP